MQIFLLAFFMAAMFFAALRQRFVIMVICGMISAASDVIFCNFDGNQIFQCLVLYFFFTNGKRGAKAASSGIILLYFLYFCTFDIAISAMYLLYANDALLGVNYVLRKLGIASCFIIGGLLYLNFSNIRKSVRR